MLKLVLFLAVYAYSFFALMIAILIFRELLNIEILHDIDVLFNILVYGSLVLAIIVRQLCKLKHSTNDVLDNEDSSVDIFNI